MITINVISALVLSLTEFLLLKESHAMCWLPLLIGVKVGQALALGETFCLLTVVFGIIMRDHAEQECWLCTLCTGILQLSGSAEGVSNGAVLWGFVYSF